MVASLLQFKFLWLLSLLKSMSKLQKQQQIIINNKSLSDLNNKLDKSIKNSKDAYILSISRSSPVT